MIGFWKWLQLIFFGMHIYRKWLAIFGFMKFLKPAFIASNSPQVDAIRICNSVSPVPDGLS